jgi:hypothetical protein
LTTLVENNFSNKEDKNKMAKELLKKAFDANAWIYTGNAEGQAVAPAKYDEMVRDYQSKALVVAPLGEQFDFTQPGSSWTVTIDEAPTAAALTSETDAAAVSAITNRQVTFTPIEYTKKYEASYTEMEDGFLKFMENASKKIGYALAVKKDEVALAALQAGATHTVYAGTGNAASTDLAAGDVLSRNALLRGLQKVRTSLYRPDSALISPIQEAQLLDEGTIYKANEFGTRAAIANGLIGNIYGLDLYVSDSIVSASNVQKAIVMGKTGTGEKAFGIATARLATVESDKDISFRKVEVVGSERYDVKVLHPGAICVVETYDNVPEA